jgi:hypothetical protein
MSASFCKAKHASRVDINQQDNDPKHTSRHVTHWCPKEGIKVPSCMLNSHVGAGAWARTHDLRLTCPPFYALLC